MMDCKIAEFIKKPIAIGNREVAGRLFLAPMAGLGHVAFRELVASFGGYGLLFTEMCNANAVPQENRHVSNVFKWRDGELATLVCQIFGSSPENMAKAARRIEDEGFFGVDINFGCSATSICKQNYGAALLKDPPHAARIVKAIREAVSIPVFVKYRIGWSDSTETAEEMAKRFEDAGADAIVFHPRVAPDRRNRPPQRDYIRKIKSAVTIPVFGNGNVIDEDDLAGMLEETGCDGVSLGRIAVARPWIFARFSGILSEDHSIYKDSLLKMAEFLNNHYDPVTAMKHFKKYRAYFASNFKFGHSINTKLQRIQNLEDIGPIVDELFETLPEVAPRPNMNMFG